MSRLIWKELREHYKLALLVMLFLGAAELGMIQPADDNNDTTYNYGMTIARDPFLLVTTFGCAGVGLLFGFLQILPELKRDRWAALLHRPTPRSRIFLGKALGGVLLYALVTVPPFLFCTWLAATPGHFPTPFVPELCLAGAADICAGLVYYFAALLIALQRGGGFGLRALPLLAAVHVTIFIGRTWEFHDAVAAAALMLLALGVAAAGAMLNRDSFAARPWPAQLALLIVAFYGLCGVADLTNTIRSAIRTWNVSGVNYEIVDEGRPLKLTYREGLVVAAQELDGSTPTNPNYKPDRVRSHARYINNVTSYVGDPHGWKPDAQRYTYRATQRYLWASESFTHPQPEQWFKIVKERSFIGISLTEKAPIGRLDENGFQSANARPTPFPREVLTESNGQYGYCLWTPQRVRFVDLPQRTITEEPMPGREPVYGIGGAWAYNEGGTVQTTTFALRTGMAFFDVKDRKLITFIPYHQDVERWGQVNAGISPALDRFYLWYSASAWIPYKTRATMPSYFEETDAQGKVLHSYTLPPQPPWIRPRLWFDVVSEYERSPAFFFGTMLYEKIGAVLGNKRLAAQFSNRFGDNAKDTRRQAIAAVVGSLVCAGVALYWARRTQLDSAQTWRWVGLALVFNLGGFIAYRLATDWPQFVACAACHRRRPIHRVTCPHCAEGWPAVTPTGTEIFDHPGIGSNSSVAAV